MDRATDRRTGHVYTAAEFSALTLIQRGGLRPHLHCPFCDATAHFRSASKPGSGRSGRVAHYYCRPHDDNCDITRRVEDPWDTENSDRAVAQWEQRGVTLVVRIVQASSDVAAGDSEIQEAGEADARSSGMGDRTRSTRTVVRGPQKLLEQLVQWPSFSTSSARLRLPDPDRTELPVHDAFVRFENATIERHTDRWQGFWGIVGPLIFYTPHDTYYSNFGRANTDFRIAIHRSHVAAILSRYQLADIHEVSGHHLLLFDHARVSLSGRFMADVNSVEHVGFLRVG